MGDWWVFGGGLMGVWWVFGGGFGEGLVRVWRGLGVVWRLLCVTWYLLPNALDSIINFIVEVYKYTYVIQVCMDLENRRDLV